MRVKWIVLNLRWSTGDSSYPSLISRSSYEYEKVGSEVVSLPSKSVSAALSRRRVAECHCSRGCCCLRALVIQTCSGVSLLAVLAIRTVNRSSAYLAAPRLLRRALRERVHAFRVLVCAPRALARALRVSAAGERKPRGGEKRARQLSL